MDLWYSQLQSSRAGVAPLLQLVACQSTPHQHTSTLSMAASSALPQSGDRCWMCEDPAEVLYLSSSQPHLWLCATCREGARLRATQPVPVGQSTPHQHTSTLSMAASSALL